MIPDDALNAKPGYVQETICEADNESKNFRRNIGGIAGITSNKDRADLLHFSNITLNNHIFDSSGMNCHADDEEVKFSAMVGGFGGMLLHSSLSNIELGGYTQIVNEKCPSFVSHIGGFIGSEKHCDYNSVHLSNIQINLPNTTAVTALGGLMGYSDSSKISSCSIEDASISVNDGNKIGGIVGNSKSTTIEDCQVADIEIQAKDAESVGLVAGHTTQARISDINVIKTDEKDNLLFVGKGTKIGGITGNSENSTFENFEITSTQIQTSNAEYVGLVCGYANKARLSNTTLSNVNITIDGTDSTQSTTSVGGILGYAAYSNLSVCNIDNLAILIQNNNDALGKGIGGVLGDASSTSVDRCFIRHTSVHAQKANNVGLITGNANTGKVSKTTVTDSSVSGQQAVGGFVGNCQGCQISSCSPAMAEHGADTSSCMTTQKVEVDGSGTGIGGLIGNASADLNTPPNISQVSLDSITVRNVSTGNAGGLIGDASTIVLDNVRIERSMVYNDNGDKFSSTGGVIGSLRNTASVRNVYLSKQPNNWKSRPGLHGIIGRCRRNVKIHQYF